MDRRKFIRNTALGGLGFTSLTSMKNREEKTKVTILHTNDTHSRIEPFPSNHRKYPNRGGVSRRMKVIEEIRSKEKEVLLLDAGDIFQGTPYFNIYKGEVEMKLMSRMKYDASTMGNHDFDAGLDGFAKVLPLADFPFLCANYDFSDTVLNGKTKPYEIFSKGEIKIGVFGLGVKLDGLVSSEFYGDTQHLDPVATAQKYANRLKNDYKCNLVICLSHLGYFSRHDHNCDKLLAEKTDHIDLIIGGHTHTFFEEPEVRKNKSGKPVLINQVGWAGLMLGRIDFYFDSKGDPDLRASCLRSDNITVG